MFSKHTKNVYNQFISIVCQKLKKRGLLIMHSQRFVVQNKNVSPKCELIKFWSCLTFNLYLALFGYDLIYEFIGVNITPWWTESSEN